MNENKKLGFKNFIASKILIFRRLDLVFEEQKNIKLMNIIKIKIKN
jgi:hypothetical protein